MTISTQAFSSFLISTLLLFGSSVSSAKAASFTKEFFSTDVAAGTTIQAGAVAQTWATPKGTKPSSQASQHIIYQKINKLATPGGVFITLTKPPISVNYIHAKNRVLNRTINGGFLTSIEDRDQQIFRAGGITSTGSTVDQGYSAMIPVTPDDHMAPNSISASINVAPRIAGQGPEIIVRNANGPNQKITLNNSVKTTLAGTANAGTPTDSDITHSADSTAAVSIEAQKSFLVVDPTTDVPTTDVYVRNNVLIGQAASSLGDETGSYSDPMYASLDNLDTEESSVQQIAEFFVDVDNGFFSIDDSGIILSIDTSLEKSSVSFSFSSQFDWVRNPYSYGAILDSSGFSGFGLTPSSNWTISTTGNIIEAFLDFNGQQPFDAISVRPPNSLFNTEATYAYSTGGGSGVFEIKIVPEYTSVFSFLFIGGFGTVLTFKRKHKTSKTTEKELEKVS